MVVTKGAPPEVVAKISRGPAQGALGPGCCRRSIIDNGLVVDNMPRDEWIAFAKKTLVQWGDVARKNNIKVQ